MLERIKKIAEANGEQIVKMKTVEELNELIYAIETNNEHHIVDEVADVIITTHELMEIFEIREKVLERIEYKLDRTEKRLKLGGKQ